MRRTSVPFALVVVVPLASLAACGSSGSSSTSGDASTLDSTVKGPGDGGRDVSLGDAPKGLDAVASGDAPADTGSPVDTGTPGDSGADASTPVGDSVLTHHKNANRDGVYTEPAFTRAAIATLHKDTTFNVTLPSANDSIYAQPLFVDGQGAGKDLIIVATEANNVYALDASTGAVAWTKNLGTPVPLSAMKCGNINPFGVTGTPVIDWATRTLFASGLVMNASNKPEYRVFALSIDTGAPVTGWPVVVNTVAKSGSVTFNDPTQGQRGALVVLGGTLYVPFGGLYGDCNPYHGWLVAISIANPTSVASWMTAAQGGGVWSPGGVSTDGTSLYVATGNTFNASTWSGGDAVIKFAPGAGFATPAASFAPANWLALDNGDLDLGTAPIPFDLTGSTPSHLVLAFGKDGDGYLLDRTALGGVGKALSPVAGQSYSLAVASGEIISAPVLYSTSTATYAVMKGSGKACTSGSGSLVAVKVVPGSPPTLAPSWCAGNGTGSPMVTTTDGHANAIVWDMDAEGDNFLSAFDGDTGAPLSYTGHATAIPNMRRYNTPIAAKGRIFVPADKTVVAFTL